MEQKHVFLSALSIGVGVGVGLGLVSGSTVGKWTGGASSAAENAISAEQLELEMLRLVVDGKQSKVTFKDFPYFLSERTRVLLTSAAYVHLKHLDVSKHTRNLSPASRAILLSGPAELYQQMLAKALAHHFEAKLLLLDINDFSLKIQSKHGIAKKDSSLNKSISGATLERVSSFFGSFSVLPYKDDNRGTLSGQRNGLDATIRDTEDANTSIRPRRTSSVSSDMSSISGISSSSNPGFTYNSPYDINLLPSALAAGHLMRNISYSPFIRPPEDETHLGNWKSQLEEDMRKIQVQDNKNHIAEVLAANDLECDDLGSICHSDSMALNGKSGGKGTLKMETNAAECLKDPNGKGNAGAKPESKSENPTSENKNEAEKSSSSKKTEGESALISKAPKRIRPEVIPATEIGVTFSDIGSLDETKESLQELVMLPLRRPDLFNGGLLKPCRGILLFGPPGTGKTMLAKAIANEAGASFINVSMSTITSKWFGEDEKNVRALFTLAAKVSPTIIFVDEVDSMLGQRTRVGEHEAMRKIKNEFMTHWDGLLTKPGERILVLAATNRPFDLDEAIIRRFERRIMVDLPSVENREKILKTLLSKEKKKKQKDEEGKSSEDASATTLEETKDEKLISLRSLKMEDMRQAKNQVAASFASEGSVMAELKQWNELYGEGGSRKKQQLSYFL
ncbi:uncharacterized aaa domain-containing protein c24b10.10c [Phtheirospermum japonicum]|uniref:Uncharacterized aaa domain-containing protein c24b10.10c n=1 Tax=Phtheirospermum japonicum TaxID=374723 RepID=A0A830B7P1_9LAMI|nr:uncharacterized aaa domain-containing protein c24b10.10c [Phtheirospermum japonicum]